jgi:hypothetical protein
MYSGDKDAAAGASLAWIGIDESVLNHNDWWQLLPAMPESLE